MPEGRKNSSSAASPAACVHGPKKLTLMQGRCGEGFTMIDSDQMITQFIFKVHQPARPRKSGTNLRHAGPQGNVPWKQDVMRNTHQSRRLSLSTCFMDLYGFRRAPWEGLSNLLDSRSRVPTHFHRFFSEITLRKSFEKSTARLWNIGRLSIDGISSCLAGCSIPPGLPWSAATPSTDSAALRNKLPTLTSPSSSFAKLSCAEQFPKHQDLKNRENLPPRRNTSFLPSIGSPHLMLRPCPLIRMELSRDCCCDPYGPSSTSLSFQLWTPSPTILAGPARHLEKVEISQNWTALRCPTRRPPMHATVLASSPGTSRSLRTERVLQCGPPIQAFTQPSSAALSSIGISLDWQVTWALLMHHIQLM